MKIAFFGTGEFSKNILNGILKYKEIEVPLIISQPDRPVGRKKIIQETPVKKIAKENSIEIQQPDSFKNNEDIKNLLISLNLDFIIVVAYGKIIPKDILDIPKYGCINIHGSILPKYRGASPIQESIKNGDKETGLTIMYMNEKMDEGDILKIEKINIDKEDKTINIFEKFEKIGPKLLVDTLKGILSGEIKGQKQNDRKATYCQKIIKTDGLVSFSKETSDEIYNKFRAYNSWPEIYSFYNDKKIIFKDCEILEENNLENINIGQVVKLNKKTIGVACSDKKILILKQVKLEGKKTMDILSFVNGNKEFLNYKFK